MPKPNLQPGESPRTMAGWEKFFFLLALLILLYFLLARLGLSPIYRTEKTEIIDRPHR